MILYGVPRMAADRSRFGAAAPVFQLSPAGVVNMVNQPIAYAIGESTDYLPAATFPDIASLLAALRAVEAQGLDPKNPASYTYTPAMVVDVNSGDTYPYTGGPLLLGQNVTPASGYASPYGAPNFDDPIVLEAAHFYANPANAGKIYSYLGTTSGQGFFANMSGALSVLLAPVVASFAAPAGLNLTATLPDIPVDPALLETGTVSTQAVPTVTATAEDLTAATPPLQTLTPPPPPPPPVVTTVTPDTLTFTGHIDLTAPVSDLTSVTPPLQTFAPPPPPPAVVTVAPPPPPPVSVADLTAATPPLQTFTPPPPPPPPPAPGVDYSVFTGAPPTDVPAPLPDEVIPPVPAGPSLPNLPNLPNLPALPPGASQAASAVLRLLTGGAPVPVSTAARPTSLYPGGGYTPVALSDTSAQTPLLLAGVAALFLVAIANR